MLPRIDTATVGCLCGDLHVATKISALEEVSSVLEPVVCSASQTSMSQHWCAEDLSRE